METKLAKNAGLRNDICMILRFAVSNFRSINDEQAISFTASKRTEGEPGCLALVPSIPQRILRVSAIFGPNASGKTNILRALSFLSDAVRNSHRRWQPGGGVPIVQFLGSDLNAPSSFDLDFELAGTRYRYGFSTTKQSITSEWAYVYNENRPKKLFTRDESIFSYGRDLVGNKKNIESTVRPNSLFLSAAAQNNHDQLSELYKWISGWDYVPVDREFDLNRTIKMCGTSQWRESLLAMIQSADLGIVGLDVQPPKDDEDARKMFSLVLKTMPPELADTATFENSPFSRHRLQLIHRFLDGKEEKLDFGDESQGTAAFISLLGPLLDAVALNNFLLIDELDASLHPVLVSKFIELAAKLCERTNAHFQILFTSQQIQLLDEKYLLRDAVWFTQKSSTGATSLYSLSDFSPRKHENLRKGYLEGRFGATPYLDQLEIELPMVADDAHLS